MNRHHKHQPAGKKMLIGNVLDMGESINNACFKLATELTIEACDNLLFQLGRHQLVFVNSARHW